MMRIRLQCKIGKTYKFLVSHCSTLHDMATEHAQVITEHAEVITKHTHVAIFHRNDRFSNLNSRQL